MKNRTLTAIVIILAVLLVIAVVFLYRQATSDTSTPPPPTSAPTPMPITGIKWEWTGMQDSSGETTVSNPKNYTLKFNEDGTITGQADCNQISGTYSLSGSSLSIHLGASTSAYCGESSQDQLYLASLNKVSSYAADQQGLELHFSGGKMDFRDGGK